MIKELRFIEKAKQVHGNKYDYSKVEYVNNETNVCIICPIHGEFWQTPHNHLKGRGCKNCAKELSHPTKKTTKIFLNQINELYGDKYSYNTVNYISSKEKVTMSCKKHGLFEQYPFRLLQGIGCPKCGREKTYQTTTMQQDIFIEKAKQVHGNKYDYSKVEYINSKTKVCIICPIHGEFWQMPYKHLQGQICPICAKENKKYTTFSFIKKAQMIFLTEEYDYSKTTYTNAFEKVQIYCPKHGFFKITPFKHLQGCGCQKCAQEHSISIKRLSQDEFITKSNNVHNYKYQYDKSVYINNRTKILITCPKHGDFWQFPDNHLQGCGCPKCVHHISKAENEIYDYVCTLVGKENVIQSDRTILKGQELDIYIPSLNFAIEYNGLYWHSEKKHSEINYHLNKTNKCKEQGIKLLQIFEDEYRDKKEIVLNKIKHIIGVSESLPKIMGRKCEIKVINLNDARVFLNTYHIQGFAASTVYLGCYFQNELIGVMTFRKCDKHKEGFWELTRFATNYNYICQGIGGKLFSYFIKNYEYIEIKSFADRRWTVDETNNVYLQLGFSFQSYVQPNYHYVEQTTNPVRKHKFLFRKERVNKKYGLPLTMTESEMTKELNLQKIYDCGLIKYVYKKKPQ